MMFCICSTKTAKTLRAVLVSMSSMSELLLERVADPGQHRLRHIAAIGEDDAGTLQLGAKPEQLLGQHRTLLCRQRDEAENRDVVAAALLALVLGERRRERLALLRHRAARGVA